MSTIVIGAGLYGSVIAAALRAADEEVLILDRGEPWGGSRPAACLFRAGWLTQLGAEVVKPALLLLDRLYGVEQLTFKAGPLPVSVGWVPPQSILEESERANVTGIYAALNGWQVAVEGFGTRFAERVIVAAGIWTPELLPTVQVSGKLGVAFLWDGTLPQGRIAPWAPYKQLVAFERAPGEVWCGDGSVWKTMQPERISKAQERCARFVGDHVGLTAAPRLSYGWRPFCEDSAVGQPRELQPGLWVATGGGKNGLVGAAWCASVIVGRLKCSSSSR